METVFCISFMWTKVILSIDLNLLEIFETLEYFFISFLDKVAVTVQGLFGKAEKQFANFGRE